MADPMRIRAQAAGDKATIRVLMSHEMETGQRKDAAFAMVVGARDVIEVLHADDQEEGPKDEGQDAEDAVGAVHVRHVREALLHRVERAGADVTEDHAEGADGEPDSGASA